MILRFLNSPGGSGVILSLQTDNLSMIALGVLSNTPPNSYQPALTPGMHLRWGFLPELGFPWHGFYLYRRPARAGTPLCLRSVIGGLKKGNWPENKHYTALGVISSNTNLVLTDDFTPTNQAEFALDGRNYLRFDLREGELARRVELQVGFRADRCLDFQTLISPTSSRAPAVARPNPFSLQGVSFAVKGSDGKLLPNAQFDSIDTPTGPLMGLKCGYGLAINLPAASDTVDLMFSLTVQGALTGAAVDAFDGKNRKIATVVVGGAPNQPKTVTLDGKNITRVEVRTSRDTAFLHRICANKLKLERKTEVTVTAFSGTTPVRSMVITGQPEKIVSASIEADAISAIEIGPGPGSLVDLCFVPVAQDATLGWEKLQGGNQLGQPGFRYPTGLPVTHTDYPCSVPDPRVLLPNRVRYQLPPGWQRLPPAFDPPNFKILRDQLVNLVKGGPDGGPMADRIFDAPPEQSIPPDPNPPHLGRFYVLDMILLGALHPGLAQLLGLYWVDQTVRENVAYDYLIVADHMGDGERDPDKVLAVIKASGFVQFDGYIVFNKRLAATPPSQAPVGLKTFELPGGTFPDAQGQLPQSSNNAGLSWNLGWDASDGLLPDSAVMYFVWRTYLGNEAKPKSRGPQVLVTKAPPDSPRPLLVTEARLPNGVPPERSPEWPIDPPLFIDRNLPDGWYRHEVSGIDLFGRHSRNSVPAQLRLLDRIPPPMPTAVEAYALDPEDRYLQQDAAYKTWRTSLDSSVRQTLVGLRVRWIWTRAHQQQAPDTREFRIYLHPGATPPLDHDQPIHWQERFYVVGYSDNVTIDSVSQDRFYEVFVPSAAAPNPTSIPLNPSLANPVVYAHIAVSAADDKPHTNDQRTSGNWRNRPGNEGRVGPPAKIYRVWRTPPPAPDDIQAGNRHWASPADYHSRSFFTYRWNPQTHLKVHVFRAMDDAVFKADWAKRPSTPPLSQSQLEFFPAGWNQATRQQVADALNHLNTLVGPDDRTAEAMAYYRQLSDAALRVLAGLPNSESAFIQLTINALNDKDNLNRRGPDNSDNLVLDVNQRAFIDTLDGRSTNRYFYRAAFVDAALKLGPLGLSSPPVYLPNVVPPRVPVITKILGGERQITIKWASNREPDLAGYRIYRTEIEESARDVRLMEIIATLTQANINLSDPSVEWTDNHNLIGGRKYYYRLAAVDTSGNESKPTPVKMETAVDNRVPPPPIWTEQTWLLRSQTDGGFIPWPADGIVPEGFEPVLRLGWQCETPEPEFVVRRWREEEEIWAQPDNIAIQTNTAEDFAFLLLDYDASYTLKSSYRLKVRSSSGVWSAEDAYLIVSLPNLEESIVLQGNLQ
jgi:hypothetical protein